MEGKDRKCSECSKTFSATSHYDRHMRTHTGEKPFKCVICDKCFTRDEQLKIHLRLHTGETPFKCKLCNDQFPSSCKLKRHMFTHTGAPYKCPSCPSAFGFPSHLKTHSVVHTEDKPFECSECFMKFKAKRRLQCHMQCHTTTEKPFSCDICPKKYRQKHGLKNHLRIHSGERFKCTSCDFQTFHKSHLRTHLINVHDPESSSVFQCTLCMKTYKGKDTLEHHIRVHTGEKPYKCKFCGKSFISSTGMETCIRKHTGEKPYESQRNPHKCDICHKFFKGQSQLKIHMVVHTGERAFHCTQCPKKFGSKRILAQHLSIHNGGDYKCNFCEKEFFLQCQLVAHVRLHTGEKPFKCKLCPYKNRSGIRESHTMNHEKEEKFKCRFCTFSSKSKGTTTLHEENIHGSAIVSIANNSEAALNSQNSGYYQPKPLTCNECKFSCFSESYLCIHYIQCHSLPRVIAKKLCTDGK